LLIITAGTNTLRFIPPLVIQREVVEEGLDILGRAMEAWLEGIREERMEVIAIDYIEENSCGV